MNIPQLASEPIIEGEGNFYEIEKKIKKNLPRQFSLLKKKSILST